ncbi:YdaU family protein [Moraxella lincolnii]
MRITILNKKTTHHNNIICHPKRTQKATTIHYYGFHIKDYRARTAHLTPLEHYIYCTLIDWYYLNEKPFSSVEEIARYLLLPLTDENTQAINNVLDEFFNFHKGKYHHTRINQEIKNFKAGRYTLDNNNPNAHQKQGNQASHETVTESHEAGNGNSHAQITQSHGKNDAITINHKPLTNDLFNPP